MLGSNIKTREKIGKVLLIVWLGLLLKKKFEKSPDGNWVAKKGIV
jgi:hypothetical protein